MEETTKLEKMLSQGQQMKRSLPSSYLEANTMDRMNKHGHGHHKSPKRKPPSKQAKTRNSESY